MQIKGLLNALKKVVSVNVLRYASQLLVGILIARYLGPSEKGLIFIFTTVSSTLAILLSFGIVNSLIYHCKKSLLDLKYALIYFGVLQLALLAGLAVSAHIFQSSFLMFLGLNSIVGSESYILLLVAYTSISLTTYFINSYSLAYRLMDIYFLSFGVVGLLVVLVVFIGLVFLKFETVNILQCIVLIEFIISMFCIFVILYRSSGGDNEGKKLKIFKYAISSYLGVSGSTLSNNGDSIVLALLLSNEQLGIYSIAKTFYRLVVLIPQTINGILFGIMCDLSLPEAIKLVKKITIKYIFFSIFLLLMSFILLDDFIEMVYGYGFVKAYYPSLILMLAASIFGVSSSVNPLLLANNKPFYSSKVTLISSSVSLTLCAMSTLKLGILGASISVLVGAIITFSMRFFYLNLLKKTNYENK